MRLYAVGRAGRRRMLVQAGRGMEGRRLSRLTYGQPNGLPGRIISAPPR